MEFRLHFQLFTLQYFKTLNFDHFLTSDIRQYNLVNAEI